MRNHDELVGWGGTLFGSAMTMIQTNETFQLIQAILSIIALFITTAYTLWKWYRKASKDGKITEDEVDELFEDLNNIKEENLDDKSRNKDTKK
jgi:multisubunit Na+/H+ antiporter MnhG subunit